MGTTRLSPVRRTVVRLTVGSFSLAALLGVAALLRPGRFGGTEGRILLTTLIVGVTSVLMLCYLAPTGDRSRLVGMAGEATALLSAVSVLVMVWGYRDTDPPIALVRTFGVTGVLALTCAQFSLLLSVARRRASVVRLLAATLVLGSVMAALVVAAILGWNPSDTGARLIGVVAILDVLGTVVTMALGVFGTADRSATGSSGDGSLSVVVPASLAARLREQAQVSGRTPEDLVVEAVESLLGAGRQG
jgi:hypothetical protein